jgi:hypothetical protein
MTRLPEAIQQTTSQLTTSAEMGLRNPNDASDQAMRKVATMVASANNASFLKIPMLQAWLSITA